MRSRYICYLDLVFRMFINILYLELEIVCVDKIVVFFKLWNYFFFLNLMERIECLLKYVGNFMYNFLVILMEILFLIF